MGKWIFSTLLLFIYIGCSTPKLIIPPKQPKGMRTPALVLPDRADKNMVAAASVFWAYANSDEFYIYAKKKIGGLDGGNEKNIDMAITKFRLCLDKRETVNIEWRKYSGSSRVIGGWRTYYLAQNPTKKLDVIQRAGHWIHEISHACGFTYIDNDIVKFPIIKRSWPYQVGNTFEAFLRKKAL